MADFNNALIYNSGRLATLQNDTVANLIQGAQLGIGAHLPMIDAATPAVFMPIVPIVTHSPTMFQGIDYYDATLKALVERHAKSIEGIDFGYQLESASTPAGHDGQELHMPTNSKRTAVSPSFVWHEVTGNLVWNFIANWIRMIKNPDTQASGLAALTSDTTKIPPQLFSYFSMDVLFIQYDQTMQPGNIIDAFFITNMWPQETGNAGWKKQVGQSESPERTIPFHGVVQHNKNTKIIGRQVAQMLSLHKVDFSVAQPVAQTIASRLQQEGLRREVTESVAAFKEYAQTA